MNGPAPGIAMMEAEGNSKQNKLLTKVGCSANL